MLEPAERLRDRFWLSSALSLNGALCQMVGDWHTAREFSNRSIAVSSDYGNRSIRAVLEYQVGDFAQGSMHLEQLLEVVRRTPPGPSAPHAFPALVVAAIARITGLPDKLEVAEAAAQNVLSYPSVTPLIARAAVSGLALLAVVRKDVVAAKQQYDSLQRQGTEVTGLTPFTSVGIISFKRLLGLLAETMDNLHQATAHFEDALTFCRKAGYRPELAWTCCDYADTLLQWNGPGDREKAMSLLDESLAISSELGMRPLMERVLSRREILKA